MLIRLTENTGRDVYINYQQVAALRYNNENTTVVLLASGEKIIVNGDLETTKIVLSVNTIDEMPA